MSSKNDDERKRRRADEDDDRRSSRRRDDEDDDRRSSRRRDDEDDDRSPRRQESPEPKAMSAKKEERLFDPNKTGVYIPPARLAQMQQQYTDPNTKEYQRIAWEALKKSINGIINKINKANIKNLIPELFGENLVRGRGLFARSCMKAQAASPTFTHVYAALVAVVNTKMPANGELILKRLLVQFRRAYKRNDKPVCLSTSRFIAHLVNQRVAHEIVALQILTLLLERPTDDSVEVAVGFIRECGQFLADVSPKGSVAIFERFRSILHEGQIDKRVQYTIEVLFQVRKDKFKDHPAIEPELDLVEEEEQITHYLSLDDELDVEEGLDVFQFDPDYVANDEKYREIKNEILGESDDDEGDEGESDEEEDEEETANAAAAGSSEILDATNTNILNLRKTIYLTLTSSLSYEEAVHKLLKMQKVPGLEHVYASMIIECCSQERTYSSFYGLMGQRLCALNKLWQNLFEEQFAEQYANIHRLETNRLRNVAKFFAHLFSSDAISWQQLHIIHLNEEETTSSSRIFIKILFQELAESMGIKKLNERFADPFLQIAFSGLFPKDHPRNTRFAINFYTSIGLGGLTESLRDYLTKALEAARLKM